MGNRMIGYFETEKAIYSIYNGKYLIHLKAWDNIPGFKYHDEEITQKQYLRAYRTEK